MRRATTITLAIMGGGVMAVGAAASIHQHTIEEDCRRALATLRPDVEQVCQRANGGSGGGHGSGGGGGSGGESSSSARGGFGASAGHGGGGE